MSALAVSPAVTQARARLARGSRTRAAVAGLRRLGVHAQRGARLGRVPHPSRRRSEHRHRVVPDQGLLHQELTVARREVGGPPAAAARVRPVLPLLVRGLRVVYGPRPAVDGLDLTVEAGSVVGLVGPNGCGKTTTLRAVLGPVQPDAGTIDVQGLRGGTLPARALVASVLDEPTGLDELSVAELLQLTALLWRAESDFVRRAELLLGVFGLHERARSQLGSLSHGHEGSCPSSRRSRSTGRSCSSTKRPPHSIPKR